MTIRTEQDGQLVEALSFEMDTNPIETLAYIYSVCGANEFGLGHFTYQ